MSNAETVLAQLLLRIQEASVDQFMLFARKTDVCVADAAAQDLPFLQQMTHILITGSEVEVTFKTHFMVQDAVRFTEGKLAIAAATTAQGIDFMKEYCNLVAGKTKAMLEAVGLEVGQSLPFSIQGYNEIFYPRADLESARAAWRLGDALGTICCSVAVQLRGQGALLRLAQARYTADDRAAIGDVELF